MEGLTLFNIFSGIIALFFISLIVKSTFLKNTKKEFCAICLSISLTWIILLVLFWMNLFENVILLALLIGQSTVGLFYLLEHHVPKQMTFFRLPSLLSLTLIGYLFVGISATIFETTILLLVLWGIFLLIYLFQNNYGLNKFVKKVVECCKRW